MHCSFRKKCLERQKTNNRGALSGPTFLMIGWRSLFSSMLSPRVCRCGEEIAVCVMASLRLDSLISHVQYNTICELFTELQISHSGSVFHPLVTFHLFLLRQIVSQEYKMHHSQQYSDNLQFGMVLCQLAKPSAGAAASHIWGCGTDSVAQRCDIVWHSRVGT